MSLYNEDELEAPEWINHEFLEDVLQNYENNKNLKINKVDITPASMKGDHYASIMFRCKISYNCGKSGETKEKSLIIKTLPEEGAKAEKLQESKVFETEISMYTQTLPKIEQILRECGEPTKLAADIIYHALQPHKVLIFEDLCQKGYDTLRTRYLNEAELQLIYRKVAKLHAVSFMLGQSAHDHECVTRYDEGIFCNSAIMKMDFMSKGIFNFMDLLEQHKDLHIYLAKVKALQPYISENCKQLYNAFNLKHKEIFVLNHGDFHMKNLMFKFNHENHLDDLIMVDYQISCYAPSCIDMIYSQYMLLSPELRMRRHEFMQYYFEEFVNILKKIQFKGALPCYSDFVINGLKYRHFSIFLFSTFLPMVINFMISSPSDLKDYDAAKLMENPEKMMSDIYKNPEFINEIKRFMPVLLREGYLD